MKGDACTYILTPESLFEVVSKVEVFVSLFVCLFLTAIRKTKKTLISLQVTHIISVSHTLTFQTHNYADAHPNMQNPWKQMAQFFTSTQKQSSCFFQSVFPPFHLQLQSFLSASTYFSISISLQSLQSAVSYRIPLQPSDAAFQKKQRCTSVCSTLGTSTCAIQCKWETSIYFLLCTAKVIRRHTTLMSPDNIYGVLCASWVFAFFPWSGTCCKWLEFWLRSTISHIGDSWRHGGTESNWWDVGTQTEHNTCKTQGYQNKTGSNKHCWHGLGHMN